MTLWLLLVVGLSFVAVMLGLMGLYWTWQAQQMLKAQELARRLGTQQEDQVASLFRARRPEGGAAFLGKVGEHLDELIDQAGRPYTQSVLLTRVGFFAILGFVGLFVLLRSPLALIGLLAGYLPILLVTFVADARSNQISEQLPDGLDLIARALQAGHGMGEALRSCSEEMANPMAEEFARVAEEANLGIDFRVCMQNLMRRNPRNFDLKLFSGSVLLQRDTGGNLVEILNNISATIRSRYLFKGKLRALTAEAKISAYILGSLPLFVSLVIIVIQPGYLVPLVEDPLGRLFLFGGLSAYVTGVYVMWTLTQIDV